MAVEPFGHGLGEGRAGERIRRGSKRTDEELGRDLVARNGVGELDPITEVDEHLLAGTVMVSHHDRQLFLELTVAAHELRVLQPVGMFGFVLLP